ncbi:hypothetical protein BpHYR1_054458 [Brachionus plicatilis]|uniref:Secreted protein n=1 Tax=Brachionus plicatilis TaxID=10195 RepID=A0A3M7QGF7_BRAPC|nr:hypothetical protein BpHYR1_054458 [Brachionus plicatilis]
MFFFFVWYFAITFTYSANYDVVFDFVSVFEFLCHFEKITKSDSLLRLLFSTKLASVPAVRVLVVDWGLSSNSEIFFCCSVIIRNCLLELAVI